MTTNTSKPKSIRLKVIKPVYETLTIKEPLPDYLARTRKIRSSNDVYDLFRYLAQETKEHFVVLHLDTKNKIMCVDQVSVGSLSASIVHPREVFKSCMLSSCAGLILLHNHPSGDPSPSKEDTEITNRLKEGADLLGIRLLDHVVIGDGSYVSYADGGLI
ncbi:MAG: DNA repair protein RadC [Candidatus Bathyarchaeota archaeon]|nr:DNA repair protein RadC [Candidatus Bathyarchaeota archaeon]